MNKELARQPLALNLSREMWEALTLEQQQEQRARFVVSVAPRYVPSHDLDMSVDQLRAVA